MTTQLDHLVVTCASLDQGVAWLEEQLGCSVSPGGVHTRMGTHNAVVRIGPRTYLEVIAVLPEAERPSRDRWFGLDFIGTEASPRLAAWVARSSSMDIVISSRLWSADSISNMSRGSLEWTITIPSHEEWSLRSHLPLLIQWGDSRHPTDRLPDVGVRLQQLTILDRDPGGAEIMLRQIQCSGPERIVVAASEKQGLIAELATPRGLVVLSGVEGQMGQA